MQKQLIILSVLLAAIHVSAEVYHVRPDGNDSNSGLVNSPEGAWRSIDRGQPTRLTKSTKKDQTTIFVKRTSQLPASGTVKIGTTKISYTGKTHNSLTGCQNTPKSGSGSLVNSLDNPLKPGDTIFVHQGVYTSLASSEKQAVALITEQNRTEKPITFHGVGLPAIDGQLNNMSVLINGASGIILKGFDIRRGGVNILHSKNIKIANNRIHGGRKGVLIRFSKNVEVTGNKLYDFKGAWTSSPISLGSGSSYKVSRNTIALSNYGISIFDKTGTDFVITNNIITRCRKNGISVAENVTLSPSNIRDNCIWNVGKVTWLQNVAKQKEGRSYYKDLNFTPEDIHQDPQIISFEPSSPNFLDIATTSPCAKHTPIIGAGEIMPWAINKGMAGINRIVNGNFEGGWYGWDASAWQPFSKGEINWEMVAYNKQKCLRIDNFPVKGEKQPSIKSLFIKIDRGAPIHVRFRAKSQAKKRGRSVSMDVGLNVPSWNSGSDSAKQRVHVSEKWQFFDFIIPAPAAYYPNSVSLRFMPRGVGTVWIDDVELWQHQKELKSNITMSINQELPGAIVRPDGAVNFALENPYDNKKDLLVKSTINTPGSNKFTAHERQLELIAHSKQEFDIKLPQDLTGAIILNIEVFDNSEKIIDKSYRLLIGNSAKKGRNKDFFGINPRPSFRNPADLENAQKMYKTAADLGIGTLHHYLNIEQMQQLYDKPWATKMVADARQAGLEWLWTLQNNKLFTGKRGHIPGPGDLGEMATGQAEIKSDDKRLTPKQLTAWEIWLKALAKKYGDDVKYWEICNEPNCYLNADEYMKILKLTSSILRENMPEAKIIGGSLVNAFNSEMWKKTITEGKGCYDYFSYHPYRFGLQNPFYGRFPKQLTQTKNDLYKAQNSAKILITEEYRETGPIFSTHFSDSEKEEANSLARMLIRSLAEGCVGYHHHHGYFADWNLTPDLCLTGVHTIASILGDAEPVGPYTVPEPFVAYQFKVPYYSTWLGLNIGPRSDRTVIAIWSKNTKYQQPEKLPIKLDLEGASVTNIFGNKVSVTNNTVLIGNEILFISLPTP